MSSLTSLVPGALIAEAIVEGVKAISAKANSGEISELEKEAMRQNIESSVLKEKARIEQELAIARRIETAEEVEIEEYFDKSGKGSLGLQSEGEGFTLGASGSGRGISKRVYKFNGFREESIEVNDSE